MMLEKLHADSRAKLEGDITKEQKVFDAIHERRNTDPAMVKGLQDKRDEGYDHLREGMAKNQENERKDVAEHGLSDKRRRDAQELHQKRDPDPHQR